MALFKPNISIIGPVFIAPLRLFHVIVSSAYARRMYSIEIIKRLTNADRIDNWAIIKVAKGLAAQPKKQQFIVEDIFRSVTRWHAVKELPVIGLQKP